MRLNIFFQDKIAELAQEWESEVAVNYFVQYHLHLQLLEASKYAASKGIGLKGDLPIGVNRYRWASYFYCISA